MNKQQKWLNISICYILLYATMNTTMMNVALPQFSVDFSLTPSEVSWITAIFSLFFGIGSVAFGKFSDTMPIRRLLVIGLIIFMAGSLIGLLSQNYWMVIAARIIQGLGAGALPALSLVAASRFYPKEHQGYALAMVFSMVALGGAVGPIIGGFLTDWFGWQALFAISFLSLAGLPLFLKFVPKEEATAGTFDTFGAILFMIAITLILMGINVSAWLLLLAVIFLVLFFWKNKYTQDPFIDTSVLKNQSFSLVLIMSFLNTIAYMATIFILPLVLALANGLSANIIGLVLFPGALLTAILGPQVGKLIDKWGSRLMNQLSFTMMAIAFIALSTLIGSSPVWISTLVILVSLGFTANQTAFSNHISKVVSNQHMGISMGLFTLMTFLASAIGIALASRFLEVDTGHWNIWNTSVYSSYSNSLLLIAAIILSALVVLKIEKTITNKANTERNKQQAAAEEYSSEN